MGGKGIGSISLPAYPANGRVHERAIPVVHTLGGILYRIPVPGHRQRLSRLINRQGKAQTGVAETRPSHCCRQL